ncbi:MAG TPA: ankyrin repeat domain-containing protein [Terriglobales bacterium]
MREKQLLTIEARPTPLMDAASRGLPDFVRLLLDNGADVKLKNADPGITALLVTTNAPTARVLIEHGADVNQRDEDNSTLLMLASSKACFEDFREERHGCLELVDLLLSKGADVNAVNRNGKTALSLAAEGENTAIALLLKNAGAAGDFTPVRSSLQSELVNAAKRGMPNAVRLLLAAGANRNEAYNDRTPLQAAAENGDPETVKVLLDGGASVN